MPKYYCIEPATKDKPGVAVLPTMQEPESWEHFKKCYPLDKAHQMACNNFKSHLASLPKFPTSCDRVGWFEASEERYETKLGSAWYRCSKWVYDNAVRRGASVRKFIVPQSKEGAIKELKEITNGHWDKFNSNEEINKELGRESEEKDLAPEEKDEPKDEVVFMTVGELVRQKMEKSIVDSIPGIKDDTLTHILYDAIYPNSIPIILFRNMVRLLDISFPQVVAAMWVTFDKLEESKRKAPQRFDTRSDLWECKEALQKYINRLWELLNDDDKPPKVEPQPAPKEEEIISKLLSRYPSGIIVGAASVIVGDLGLTIEGANPDGTKWQKRFNPNDAINVTEVRGNQLILHPDGIESSLSPSHFKGIKFQPAPKTYTESEVREIVGRTWEAARLYYNELSEIEEEEAECDVDGCTRTPSNGGGCWRETGYWSVCMNHSDAWRNGNPQPKMKQAAVEREASRGKDGWLPSTPPEPIITKNPDKETFINGLLG
jgi:hypothetical protein